ncbi:MAG: hypothetical protein ACREPZ_09685 [Rhodanobacteraceae bacterium]
MSELQRALVVVAFGQAHDGTRRRGPLAHPTTGICHYPRGLLCNGVYAMGYFKRMIRHKSAGPFQAEASRGVRLRPSSVLARSSFIAPAGTTLVADRPTPEMNE